MPIFLRWPDSGRRPVNGPAGMSLALWRRWKTDREIEIDSITKTRDRNVPDKLIYQRG